MNYIPFWRDDISFILTDHKLRELYRAFKDGDGYRLEKMPETELPEHAREYLQKTRRLFREEIR